MIQQFCTLFSVHQDKRTLLKILFTYWETAETEHRLGRGGAEREAEITFANFFPHLVGCLFVLLMVSLAVQRLFILRAAGGSVSWASDSWCQLRSWSQGGEFRPCAGFHTGRGAYLKKRPKLLFWCSPSSLILLLFPLPEEPYLEKCFYSSCQRNYCLYFLQGALVSSFGCTVSDSAIPYITQYSSW